MIELFFVTCMVATPEICKNNSLLFEERGGLFGCMMQSQNELARWVASHPGESVRAWECRYAGSGGRDA